MPSGVGPVPWKSITPAEAEALIEIEGAFHSPVGGLAGGVPWSPSGLEPHVGEALVVGVARGVALALPVARDLLRGLRRRGPREASLARERPSRTPPRP